MMREDHYTNSEHDAATFERMRDPDDPGDRPTRLEAVRDEYDDDQDSAWEAVQLTPYLTYRQFDHWCSRGLINATRPGSGHPRTLTTGEAQVLTLMADLVHAGVTPAAAAPLARQLATVDVGSLGSFHVSRAER